MRVEIPENKERFCSNCSTHEETVETEQKPVAIKIRPGRGCFGGHRRSVWEFECLECGGIQY